jgi:hypothetical protein
MLNLHNARPKDEKVRIPEGGLMKSRISIVLATVLAFLVGTSMALHAQTQITTLFKVEVPFEFMVGSSHLSAGHYTVSHVGSKWILFQNDDRKAAALTQVMVSGTPARDSLSLLVFNRYRDRHFLSKIWTAEDQQMHACYQSRAEQTLLASQRRSGTVTLVAKR